MFAAHRLRRTRVHSRDSCAPSPELFAPEAVTLSERRKRERTSGSLSSGPRHSFLLDLAAAAGVLFDVDDTLVDTAAVALLKLRRVARSLQLTAPGHPAFWA